MRAPVDHHVATFEELVAQVIAELDEQRDLPFLDDDEDALLGFLAQQQRRHGRSLRSDAAAAAIWRTWVAYSRHAGSWRARRSS